MTLLLLCWEFFKTGLFAVGGGLATLPFLNQMSVKYPHWFTTEMLADMVAVSESTPGPIGVNMATYVGYTVAGIPGALLATCSLVLPSLITILIVARVLDRFQKNRYVITAFEGLRPAVAGLIAAAGWSVFRMAILTGNSVLGINWVALALFAVLFFFTQFKPTKKLHPLLFIAVGALFGVLGLV